MAKDITFVLDITGAGAAILQEMAAPVANDAAQRVAERASAMAVSMDRNPPSFTVFSSVGTIKRGQRAIATVKANDNNARQHYIARMALLKAKDASSLN